MTVCNECGGTVIEYDHSAGNGFCVGCGTVVEENLIVNEINFGETSNGAAMVQGSFVAQGATHARMSGPYGNRGSSESREQTIANANRKIQSIANALRLSEVVCLAATRLYTLAVEHKFTKGRKSLNVVAVCLYVACRQKETKTYMLIDFSDLLQVNVFELGHTYLQLVQTLNLRLPLVDPSHYISRFAALLEFGDETHKVATDAVRLVQRFDRDWMTRGRRPAGICGAALLLAARMNNFRRSVEEIVQVVKIADTTLKKRLEEFRKTPSGSLTLADFRNVWLEDEMDPPAFTKGREREERERDEAGCGDASEGEQEELGNKRKGKKAKGNGKKAGRSAKGKRKRGKVDEEYEGLEEAQTPVGHQIPFDPSILAQGILAGAFGMANMEMGGPLPPPPLPELDLSNIDPVLLQQEPMQRAAPPTLTISIASPSSTGPLLTPASVPPSSATFSTPTSSTSTSAATPLTPSSHPLTPGSSPLPPLSEIEENVSTLLTEEVSIFLHNKEGALLSQALDEAEQKRLREREERRLKEIQEKEKVRKAREAEEGRRTMTNGEAAVGVEKEYGMHYTYEDEEEGLDGLDENELDRFILSEEEVRIKERVWVELNRDYLEALAAKGDQGGHTKSRKRRKTTNKPRDASTPAGGSAAESVRNLIKKNPKYSKRINYDALKDLFVDGAGGFGKGDLRNPGISDEKGNDGEELYTFDDDKDDGAEPMVVIEEGEASVVGVQPPKATPKHPTAQLLVGDEKDDEKDDDDDDEEDADVDGGWEDGGWEQEV